MALRAQHGADRGRPVPRDGFRGLREPSERAAAKLPKENLGCFLAQRCTPPGQTVTRRYPSKQGRVAVVASHCNPTHARVARFFGVAKLG
jgi:hypothetical protein